MGYRARRRVGDHRVSKEVGAFLAGVSLAATPIREMLSSRLVSLRDFLLLFFFLEWEASWRSNSLHGQPGKQWL